ncbi:MAG: 1-deoxy-D-xylulose-5-phosphate synthase [Lachnospiraceae bacterium]|nr:1-deoxy-D-xylulose-5-phosphate synthase [Lachnospiraceae bacterium]
MSVLDKIQQKNDIKKINPREYDELARDIRKFLVDKVSAKGGHLASNLGAVELTMALHLCMRFPEDKLIFDVGHQAYTHKLLTGRREGFETLREYGGMSGFPKIGESDCDAFNTGHSSTSISAAMGYAVARDMKHGKNRVAAVIGDGSLTGGMAYEAINSLAQTKTGCVIILNDNEMSIDKNVGGLSKYLNSIRVGSAYNDFKSGVEQTLLGSKAGTKVARTLKRSKDTIKQFFVPGMFFEELGITYVGPIDGHDVGIMVSTFEKAFRLNKPIIIHVKTKKGKGYPIAEKHPSFYHGISSFDPRTGKPLHISREATYTDVFGKHMVTLGTEHKNLVSVTAAMTIGTGLKEFTKTFPDRAFDVGIAEQHAVTFAAGLAMSGIVPVVAVYSSFLQRAYDQILHDVCLQGLHVILAVDRSGLVGQDGETHQGIYDVSYLSHLPGMTVVAPKNAKELKDMMDFAVEFDGPIAIKYSRGVAYTGFSDSNQPIVYGKSEYLVSGRDIAIIACGNMVEEGEKLLHKFDGTDYSPTFINARFLSTIDQEMLRDIANNYHIVVTMEENITSGGYGEKIAAALTDIGERKGIDHIDGSIRENKVEHGTISVLRRNLGIDADSIYERIMESLGKADLGD